MVLQKYIKIPLPSRGLPVPLSFDKISGQPVRIRPCRPHLCGMNGQSIPMFGSHRKRDGFQYFHKTAMGHDLHLVLAVMVGKGEAGSVISSFSNKCASAVTGQRGWSNQGTGICCILPLNCRVLVCLIDSTVPSFVFVTSLRHRSLWAEKVQVPLTSTAPWTSRVDFRQKVKTATTQAAQKDALKLLSRSSMPLIGRRICQV